MLSTRAVSLRGLATSRHRFASHRLACHRFASTSTVERLHPKKTVSYTAVLEAKGPVAKKLKDTGVWRQRRATRSDAGTSPRAEPKRAKPAPKPAVKGDKTRVNIVSEQLCDDILAYVGKSLERHRGCDILDLSPGAGLWSRKLNDFLKPRSHILMEPEAELYKPFLKDLLDRPGTRLVPESGVMWSSLTPVLSPDYFPHQKPADQTHQNDTLLVTANLAHHPRKRFLNFESIAQLVLHQFIEAIRTSKLFQQYGQVRMLIWCRREDKPALLPRILQRRKRAAIDAEMNCSQINEVVGHMQYDSPWYGRDTNLDLASAATVAERMEKAGVVMPENRTPQEHKVALEHIKNGTAPVPGSIPPTFLRSYDRALKELNENEDEEEEEIEVMGSTEKKSILIKKLGWRLKADQKKFSLFWEMEKSLERVNDLHRALEAGEVSDDEVVVAEQTWDEELSKLPLTPQQEYFAYRDNLHFFRQDPPVLLWDQRTVEPLTYEPTEFFPNVETVLLDIQPKTVHPLLRDFGPRSDRAGETFEMLTKTLMTAGAQPLAKQLDALWPGAADWILPRWTALSDLDAGGRPARCRGAKMTARNLNTRQWEQLLELWMSWPLRPDFSELLTRASEESASDFLHDAED